MLWKKTLRHFEKKPWIPWGAPITLHIALFLSIVDSTRYYYKLIVTLKSNISMINYCKLYLLREWNQTTILIWHEGEFVYFFLFYSPMRFHNFCPICVINTCVTNLSWNRCAAVPKQNNIILRRFGRQETRTGYLYLISQTIRKLFE